MALAVVGAVGGGAISVHELLAHDTNGGLRHLQVFVEPHPDDALEGIAALSVDPTTYTVFVTMTHGERTSHCKDYAAETQAQWGEAVPKPEPKGGIGSWSCNWARLDSWTNFWWDAADGDPAIPKVRGKQQKLTFGELPGLPVPVNHNYTSDGKWRADRDGDQRDATAFVHVGEQAAQVAFNAGDGDVTPEEVQWAVRTVVGMRGHEVPDLPVTQVVASAYYNVSEKRDFPYDHPDHKAVLDGVRAEAGLAKRGALLVTYPDDPAANETHALSKDRYDALMGLGPRVSEAADSYRRKGAGQVDFGWLAFPHSYWARGEKALASNDVLFPRKQYFVRVK